MKIGLFIPCYINAIYPNVGVASYKLLTSLGLDVDYPLDQTCCGQPMANGGFENKGEGWRKLIAGNIFNRFCATIGVAVTIYSGFLLTQAVGVTLWNTALIPLLWIMSGMASSIGCIELLAISGRLPHDLVSWSRRTALWVEAAELFTIFAFVHVAMSSTSAAARAGAEALLSGPQSMMFLLGVILFGSLIPIAINLTTRNHKAVAVGAVLGIIGAILLRASVLFAGYYEKILL